MNERATAARSAPWAVLRGWLGTLPKLPGLLAGLKSRPRATVAVTLGALALLGFAFIGRPPIDPALTAVARRGDLQVRLVASGTLKPARSITYRSPLGSREAEVVFLAPEGTIVGEGDLVARVEARDLPRELERSVEDQRRAKVDLQVAEAEREEGAANLDSLADGEGALSVDEARLRLQIAEKKAERLRGEYAGLKPLFEKGFITRDELEKSEFELEQAEGELGLAKKRADLFIGRTHPRDRQKARLLLAQKEARLQNARAQLSEAEARVKALRADLENCSLYARAPGVVVYEDFLGTSPRRKVRLGERVTASQGLVTIPEVNRMLVEASVPEAEVHRLHPGQAATIRVEALPSRILTGRVGRVGSLARASAEQPLGGKRFDLVVEVDSTDAELRPEMTARVDVLVSDRRGVLLIPVHAVFEQQGAAFCYVVRRFGVQTRRIEVGETDDRHVEVRAGIADGDRVALVEAVATRPGPPPDGAGDAPKSDDLKGRQLGPGNGSPLAPR